jgi:hypothetical protein
MKYFIAKTSTNKEQVRRGQRGRGKRGREGEVRGREEEEER